MKNPLRSSALIVSLVSLFLAAGCGDTPSVRPCPDSECVVPPPLCSVSSLPFTVMSVSPANGVTGASIVSHVEITFSFVLDPKSVTSATVKLMMGDTLVPVAYTVSGDHVTLTPVASLAYNTTYTGVITAGVTDCNGSPLATEYRWSFTTESPPLSPLSITSVSPADGAVNVLVTTPVVITFSRPIDATTALASSVILKIGASAVATSTTVSGASITLVPAAALAYNTTYTGVVTTAVKDTAGIALLSEYSWSFTTRNPPLVPLAVTSVSPANGATNVLIATPVVITFSRSLDASTVSTSSVMLKFGTSSVPAAATVSGASITLVPAAALAYNTTYTGVVTTAVKDTGGNTLASEYSWSFTTETTTCIPFTLDVSRQIVDVATDELGNVFVYGYFGSPIPDIFVAKFASDGSFGWLAEIVTPDIDWPQGGITASSGKVYIQRYREVSGSSGTTRVFVDALQASNGASLWSTETDSGSMPSRIAVDSTGNVYATNTHSTVKLDSTGTIVGRTASGGSANAFAFGGLFVAGVSYVDTTNLSDRFLTRSDTSLTAAWTEWRRDTFNQDVFAVVASESNSLLCVAEDSYTATSTSATFQPYVTCYTIAGGGSSASLAWSKMLAGGRVTSAAAGSSGFYVMMDGVPPTLVKLDASGNVLWTASVPLGGSGVAQFGETRVYIAGGNALQVFNAVTGAKIQ